MKNLQIHLSHNVQEKILCKHRIDVYELIEAFKYGKPKIIKLEGKTYMAITHYLRYITMIFEYNAPIANVITAYSSPPWQKRLHKAKK